MQAGPGPLVTVARGYSGRTVRLAPLIGGAVVGATPSLGELGPAGSRLFGDFATARFLREWLGDRLPLGGSPPARFSGSRGCSFSVHLASTLFSGRVVLRSPGEESQGFKNQTGCFSASLVVLGFCYQFEGLIGPSRLDCDYSG